ncbi:hypothetical protein Tsubulata_050442 [Turnera subulata]|uniref:Uncharacterized protein n=1 Tax=Turnera subulata TaxID=218843 RepID=A0A9Q0J8C5_9ROSI|nr:hypothetical protein Tsubulata_050442 [Turnera subulata]
MNTTLVRNPTKSFSRRFDGYKPLDRYNIKHKISRNEDEDDEPRVLVPSFSYRRARARQRQIYLKSYKLATSRKSNNLRRSRSGKLRKMVAKVRTAVFSLVSFMRVGASCNSRGAICVSNPMKCC